MVEVVRSVPLLLDDDADLLATVRSFGEARRLLSAPAYNAGKPLGPAALQTVAYRTIRHLLSAQMACSAIRSVSGAYQAARSNKRPAKVPFAFRKDVAVFIIGERGRDASFRKDGSLSVWTPAGRKRIAYRVPDRLRPLFEKASRFNSLTVRVDRSGHLEARLQLTLNAPDVVAGLPIGVDLNQTNAVVAVKHDGDVFFETGLSTRVRNKRTRKTVRRLQIKLAAHKAAGKPTRSVRRALKRLGRKRSNRTKDFACGVAKRLVAWAGPGSTLVFEKLKFDRRRKGAKFLNRKLSEWPHALVKRCVRNRAELVGVGMVEVDPAYTSQTCSGCGNLGERNRHSFTCPVCGLAMHADVNAAINIRRKFAGVALPVQRAEVNRPRSSARKGTGKSSALADGS